MADKSAIEWTDATWNPVVGCSVVSPGCTHCYAMKLAARLERMGSPAYHGLTQEMKAGPVWTGEVRAAGEHTLLQPLRWTRPRRIFVNSMSDLFHERMPMETIAQVFAVMALARQHTYQVLTKRSTRMRDTVADDRFADLVDYEMDEIAPAHWHARELQDVGGWPLPNVQLGVSVEDQARADERIPHLLATPAAKRFLSCEPLLGPIDIREHLLGLTVPYPRTDALHWVICGGESGPKARPMHPNWARSLRDQCAAAGVPFFFKQWGEYQPLGRGIGAPDLPPIAGRHDIAAHGWRFQRAGKKVAGRFLDGRTHDEFPA
jgi:protein gp37